MKGWALDEVLHGVDILEGASRMVVQYRRYALDFISWRQLPLHQILCITLLCNYQT